MWIQKLGAGVSVLAFAPDGRALYVADRSGGVTAWDTVARTRRLVFKLARNDPGPISRLLTAGAGSSLVALIGGTLRAYDPATGTELARLSLPVVRETIPLPGSKPLVVSVAESRRNLLAWSLESRQPEVPFAGPFDGAVWSFDLSPDGNTVAVLTERYEVTLFDLTAQAERARFTIPREKAIGTNRMQFTPDGRSLAVFHMRDIQLWDVAGGEPVGPALPLAGRNWTGTTAFHPTARAFAAINTDGHPALFGLDTGEQLRALDFQLGTWAMCLTFSPDGLTCAVGGSNKQFVVFDVDL